MTTVIAVSDEDDGPIVFDGLNDCVLGVASVWDSAGTMVNRYVYDGTRIIESLMRDGMDGEEAAEYLDFNIQGLYAGPSTPVIVWPEPEFES